MRCFVGVLVLVGCASPRPTTSDGAIVAADAPALDAAVDGPIDARPDAPPDAPPPPPPCSTTVDLDGDGLGWECDPVEHISLQDVDYGLLRLAYLADTTFAAQIGSSCGPDACVDHVAIEVRPDRAMIRRSDSGMPVDAWLKSSMVGGPCIDSDHAAWWSSDTVGMTGKIDSAGTFQPIASPLINDCITIGDTSVLLDMIDSTSTSTGISSLAVPAAGALHPLATANFGGPASPRYQIGFAPPILGIAGQLSLSTATLVQAHPGDLAPSDVIVDGESTAVVDAEARILGPNPLSKTYAGSPSASFLVRRSGNAYVVALSATGVDWTKLPRTDFGCDRDFNEAIFCSANDMLPTRMSTGMLLRGVTMIPVFDHYDPNDPAASLTTAGTAMETIQWGPKIWVVDPNNQSRVLASGLSNPTSAVTDDVALAVGVSPKGDLVLERYRTSTGLEEITIEQGVDQTFIPKVIASAEGDAIVGGVYDTYVVPATTTTVAHLNIANVGLHGFSRGDSTVVVSGNTLYAYDDLGPGPRLTPLVALVGLHAVALDTDRRQATNYFAYGASASIARIVYSGTTPTLLEAPCAGDASQAKLIGNDHEGTPIAVCDTQFDSYVFQLPLSGPKLVARFQSFVTTHTDVRLEDHPVVAWSGTSSKTSAPTVCLATHPERCWLISGSTQQMLNIDSVADTFALFAYTSRPSSFDMWIIRPLGPGEEPQPLP